MGKIKKVNQNTANSTKNKLTSKSSKSNHNESEEENALNGINEIRVETTIGDNNNTNNKKNNNNIANKIIQVELKEFDIVDKQKDARKDGGVGLVSKVKFKATKKSKSENKLSKLKSKDVKKKEKYEIIKDNLLKQIKEADVATKEGQKASENAGSAKQEFNFVNKHSFDRVTNSVLKSILKKQSPIVESKKAESSNSFPNSAKQIKKKEKRHLKKEIWSEKISLIKKELKDSAEKTKREKTVITGDIKPMMELLSSVESPLFTVVEGGLKSSQPTMAGLTRRQKAELSVERQQAKSIQKQSIRNKKAQDDVMLFGQLLDYSNFTQNPIEALKKMNK